MPDAVERFLARPGRMLARLDEQLAQASDTHEAAWIACEFTGRELNLGDCVAYLPQADGGLVQAAAWGPRRVATNLLASRLRLPPGAGVAGDCARRLRARRVDDARDEADDAGRGHSELAVPVQHDELLLAVLHSEEPQPGFFDERYEQAFEAIAACSASHLWRLRGHRPGAG